MYLNGLHTHVLSRSSKSYSKYRSIMSIAFMIAIISGICIICYCIILILSVCIGTKYAYFKSNRKKMVNGLEKCDIYNV